MIVCLHPKSPSNHAVQAKNAGKGLCFSTVSDKKSLQLPNLRTDFPNSLFPLTLKPLDSYWVKRRTLAF